MMGFHVIREPQTEIMESCQAPAPTVHIPKPSDEVPMEKNASSPSLLVGIQNDKGTLEYNLIISY